MIEIDGSILTEKVRFGMMLTREEYARLQRVAGLVPMSRWGRTVLMEEVERQEKRRKLPPLASTLGIPLANGHTPEAGG